MQSTIRLSTFPSAAALALVLSLSVVGCGTSEPPRGPGGGCAYLQYGAQPVIIPTPRNACELDIDFGIVPIGQTETAQVKIGNTCAGGLELSKPNPTLDPEFSLDYAINGLIESGSDGVFSVTFQPYKTTTATSTFAIDTDGFNSTCPNPSQLTLSLIGTGIQLSLVVQPDVLDFGNTLINTTSKKSVTLINKSNAPVNGITTLVSGGDANLFTVDNAPTSLAANSQAMVEISYAPLALETHSLANVTFAGTNGEKAILNLFGEPVGVALTLAPNPCNFGYVPLLSTAVCCTTVSNQSNVDVNITGTTSFATEDSTFAISTTDDATPPNPFALPITIKGGDSAKVCFSFTPPITQQYQGQVTLTTTDPSGTNPIVQLIGWGGGPQITCTPATVPFGETVEGGISTEAVLCSNTGSAIPGVTLTIDPPIASPDLFTAEFDQVTDPYPLGGLAPGQSAQIDVNYAPTTVSNDKGTLFIKSNGGQGKTVAIPLAGTSLVSDGG